MDDDDAGADVLERVLCGEERRSNGEAAQRKLKATRLYS